MIPFRGALTALSALLAGSCLATPAFASAVSPRSYELTTVFGLPITNSMVTTWVISLLLIIVVKVVGGRPTLVPSRGQAVLEGIVEGMRGLLEPIVGKHTIGPVFPFLVGLFTFILIINWSGLLPGVGAFGFYDDQGTLRYWFRPGNTDLNTTLAMALISLVAWLYFCVRYAGWGVLFFDIFGNKADKRETPAIIYYLLIPIFLMVGLIEMISIAFRPVSLSLRLYGNMFGGENLLVSMTNFFAWVMPIPFYLFETLVGLIQASIFTMLVAIYIGLVCNHEGGEGDHAH
ncbi:MAG: ATP synthase F0 subunit A [Puniceicoccaceae bacterium]|nr:MAG: ATP synthase F0 subunit A [Puniceicoccaceae bacterium]